MAKMIKPIDLIPGFKPTRTVREFGEFYIIKTVPPTIVGGEGKEITLTKEQFERYQDWEHGRVLIQDALPELSPREREAIMTGTWID